MPTALVPRRVWMQVVAAIAIVAFAARLVLLLRGGGLLGIGTYDDGVYYSAADALVHGRLPYRDFLFLQPPGVLAVLTPFAWLGSVTTDALGFATARVAFMLVGAANAALVALVLRRFGLRAAVVGGGFYALFEPAAYAEHTTLLEPLGTCGVLVALVILGRALPSTRWTLLAGAALGAALVAKTWYVVPVIVAIAFHPRRAIRLLTGVVTAVVVLCLPFFAAAPVTMFQEVILDQLGRPRVPSATFAVRASGILGLPHLHGWMRALHFPLGVLLAVVLLAIIVVAWTDRRARMFVALFAAGTLLLLVAPSFFRHYPALTTPPLALIVGIGVSRLADATARRRSRLAVVAGALAATLALNIPQYVHGAEHPTPAAALQAAAADERGCITSDDPTMLAVMDALSPDLRRDCTVWPDVTGYTYARDARRIDGREVPRQKNAAWQRDVLGYLRSGEATIVVRHATGLSAASLVRLDSGRVLARDGKFVLRRVDRAG